MSGTQNVVFVGLLTSVLFATSATWDGSPRVLMPTQNVVLPQTSSGTMIFVYENITSANNAGAISLSSGSTQPVVYPAPALAHQPSFVIQNWGSNDLSVTNQSRNSATPIRIQDLGPGIPGTTTVAIPTDGSPVLLAPEASAATIATPRYMQLVLTNTTGNVSDVVLLGGPVESNDNNGYAIELNSPIGNTGVPSGTIPVGPAPNPPPRFYATVQGNSYRFEFYWGSSTVFVSNLSAQTAGNVSVSLLSL